ncbi:MAG TPA: hypothetical protein VMY69_08960, partial [Phycisphaerae bacterium]|nr:hypothetical protein [Phycisphaerae bacterium]
MRLKGWLVAVVVSVLVSGGLCGVAQGCWKVDLDIHHGQSGSLLPEDLEDEAHGATTVANLNDTDGDDSQD